MKIRLFIIILFVGVSFGAQSQGKENDCFTEINCDELKWMIETKDVLLVDVRLHKEFRKERIANSFLASDSHALKDLLNHSDKNQIILVYCEEGSRSAVAAQIICNDLQFKKVFNLQGGLIAWRKKGYYLDKERIKSSDN